MNYVLGISCFYHDSAATLLRDGEILAAAQEERFTRIKNDSSFPIHSIQYVLSEAAIDLADIDSVVYYEKPFITFERLIENHLNYAPLGFKLFSKSLPIWIKEKIFLEKKLKKNLKRYQKMLHLKSNIQNIIYRMQHQRFIHLHFKTLLLSVWMELENGQPRLYGLVKEAN